MAGVSNKAYMDLEDVKAKRLSDTGPFRQTSNIYGNLNMLTKPAGSLRRADSQPEGIENATNKDQRWVMNLLDK